MWFTVVVHSRPLVKQLERGRPIDNCVYCCAAEDSCGPTTLDWQPLSASSYAVGMLSGALAVRDIRQPAQDVLHVEPSERSLHRVLFCPDT
ncbi:hypothetical protein HPB49_005286 [Dermacentor silvarum]|uniref:Uncharacterized protein n=1 Tax=Dermacentor silvarum TaxID=543639 RepID=A0ACB8C2B7_DERSI|nr:hypothetical protein HPB49_005286 [Dermacentor silvarum]